MKNILTIFLLTLTVSCFGQTYPWMISKNPTQDADTANVLVMFPTGNGNLTGRGRLISYETFAALIDPYITGGGGISDGDKGDIIVSGGGTVWEIQPTGMPGTYAYPVSVTTNDHGQITSISGGSNPFTSIILKLNISDTASMLSHFIERGDTSSMLNHYIARSDTAAMLEPYLREQGYYWIDRHGAIANDGLNDRVAIQALLDYVESIGGGVVVVPIGVFNVTYNAINEGLYIGDNTTLLGFGSGSEIRYTGHPSASSTAIQNRRSSGQYSDFQQRTGNENINILGIKLSFTERDDFKNIGINLSGVLWGSVKDCWVDSCGGYSVLIGRTNDTDTIGNASENVIVENLKITNMMDVGLEVWGCKNFTATDLSISGRGTDVGYGIGINVWNGAKNVLIRNATIEKDTNDYDAVNRYMVAFNIDGFALGDTVFGFRKTENVTFENINSRTDIGFRINRINDVVDEHRVDSVYIRNCNFLGYDTIRNASDIRHCRTLLIEGCTFDRFARQLQFSTTSSTSYQNSVSDVTIRNNQFTWGEGIDFHGITDFNIYNNRFYYIFDQAPITVRGGRNGLIKNNYFLDIGNGTDQWCITLNKLTASVTRDTRLIEITGNTACDDRASKNTDDLITMYDATDSITVKFNVLDCADTDADQYSNIGTGTHIFTTELGLQDHDWYEEGTTRAPNAITDNIFTEAPQVGMGTTSPETNLHVQGGGLVVARVESTAGQAQVNIKGTSFGQIENAAGHFYITNAASGGDVILRADGSTEKLRLSSTAALFADSVRINNSLSIATVTSGASTDSVLVRTASTGKVKMRNAASFGGSAVWGGITGTLSSQTDLNTALGLKAPLASPTFTGTVTIPTPFTLGATSVTSTGTQLNYLNAATGTTGTTSTNLVYSTSPTLVTPILGTPTSGNLANCTFPTLNQNTTGSAATLTTPRTIAGTSFNGSANINITHANLSSLSADDHTQYALLAGRSGSQTLIGGTGTTDDLILQSTSGVGATGALIQAKVGNNGGTTAWTVLNNGLMGIGTASPSNLTAFGGAQTNPLWVSSSALTGLVVQGTTGQCIQFADNSNVPTADFGYLDPDIWFVNRKNGGDILFATYPSGVLTYSLTIGNSNKVGIHTRSEDKELEVNLGTSGAFRLTYNDNNGSAANYMDATISSTGSPTFNATGTSPTFTFSDPVLFDGYARLKAYTVATLPTGVTGAMAYVTDATAPTYLGALTGGGAVTCPVFYNGSAWVSH